MGMFTERDNEESPCVPNGYGLCMTHPTCEHVKHALEDAHNKLAQLHKAPRLDLLNLLDQAQECQRILEEALLRARQGFSNAIELGIIPRSHHDETRTIIRSITAALAKLGWKATLG